MPFQNIPIVWKPAVLLARFCTKTRKLPIQPCWEKPAFQGERMPTIQTRWIPTQCDSPMAAGRVCPVSIDAGSHARAAAKCMPLPSRLRFQSALATARAYARHCSPNWPGPTPFPWPWRPCCHIARPLRIYLRVAYLQQNKIFRPADSDNGAVMIFMAYGLHRAQHPCPVPVLDEPGCPRF